MWFRWCFWINLPLVSQVSLLPGVILTSQGGIAAAAVVFLLPAREPLRHGGQLSGWAGFKQLDFIGAGLSLAFVTCLLLALQWGKSESWLLQDLMLTRQAVTATLGATGVSSSSLSSVVFLPSSSSSSNGGSTSAH